MGAPGLKTLPLDDKSVLLPLLNDCQALSILFDLSLSSPEGDIVSSKVRAKTSVVLVSSGHNRMVVPFSEDF